MAEAGILKRSLPHALEWRVSDTLIGYPTATAEMEAQVAAIHAGTAPEMVWLLEHP
ncbi:MAG TPA: lipoate-protein ligase B, partial [Dongiaceae bacterium]